MEWSGGVASGCCDGCVQSLAQGGGGGCCCCAVLLFGLLLGWIVDCVWLAILACTLDHRSSIIVAARASLQHRCGVLFACAALVLSVVVESSKVPPPIPPRAALSGTGCTARTGPGPAVTRQQSQLRQQTATREERARDQTRPDTGRGSDSDSDTRDGIKQAC